MKRVLSGDLAGVRLSIVRLAVFLALSGFMTYMVQLYSFALAHSATGLLAFLACPGIVVVLANLLSGVPGWMAVVALNVLYYESLWRLVASGRTATIDGK